MKVTNNSVGSNVHNVGSAREKGVEDSERAKGKSESSRLDGSVRVNMSDRAQAFQKAREIAGQQTVDEAKVARLRELIDKGEYHVDASALADRLVDEHSHFPD